MHPRHLPRADTADKTGTYDPHVSSHPNTPLIHFILLSLMSSQELSLRRSCRRMGLWRWCPVLKFVIQRGWDGRLGQYIWRHAGWWWCPVLKFIIRFCCAERLGQYLWWHAGWWWRPVFVIRRYWFERLCRMGHVL